MLHAAPGQFVDVQVPLSLNVEVPVSQLSNSSWSRPDSETLVPGRVVIPLQCDSDAEIKLSNNVRVKFKEFSCELASVITFHKCQLQGRTIGKVVLDLNEQGGGAHTNVNLPGTYVGLCRVRSGKDIRILPPLQPADRGITFRSSAGGPLEHLTRLKQRRSRRVAGWVQRRGGMELGASQ